MEILSNYFNAQVSKPVNSLLCTNLFPLLGKLWLKIMFKKGYYSKYSFRFSPYTSFDYIHDGIQRPTVDSI